MAEHKLTQEEIEEKFKEEIDGLIQIAQKLAPYCQTIEEMVEMLDLAKVNPGQLRLIITLVTQQAAKK